MVIHMGQRVFAFLITFWNYCSRFLMKFYIFPTRRNEMLKSTFRTIGIYGSEIKFPFGHGLLSGK